MTDLPFLPNSAGSLIALSISDAADMGRLGYPQREVDRALFSICGALVRSGVRLAYGGNLDPLGYTFKIFRFLATAYTDRGGDAPFIHFAPSRTLDRIATRARYAHPQRHEKWPSVSALPASCRPATQPASNPDR